MFSRRYLIRRFAAGITNWFGDKPDIDLLAKQVFDLAEKEQSVYEVADGEEECLAVAAHKLADRHGKSSDAVSVLRIDRSHLHDLGIQVAEDQFGTTGIPRWDTRHRNLLGDREQLIQLIRFMVERCQRGHDQVRRIEKQLVVRTLNRIMGYPARHCPDHVKLIARWCQSSNKDSRPNLSLPEIERELAIVEFEDDAIRHRASCLRSGDPVRDWYQSLNELRRAYTSHYTSAIAERFGLQ